MRKNKKNDTPQLQFQKKKNGSQKVVTKGESYVFGGTNRIWLKNKKCNKVKIKMKGVFFFGLEIL